MNPRWIRVRGLLALLLLLGPTGCGLVAPTPVEPMPTLARRALGPERATGVLVLLPGVGDRAATFEDQGVLDTVLERASGFDVIAADAHFGYYVADSIQERLARDVLDPLRDQGYRQVWLLGVSLGAFGALAHASAHPGTVDGVLLLGPYLGDAELEESLLAAPDLLGWDPASLPPGDEWLALQRRVWTWLQRQCGPQAEAVVLLGYGDRDGPGSLDERLARALPAGRFVERPGGHSWSTWRPLIRDLLPTMAALAEARTVAE